MASLSFKNFEPLGDATFKNGAVFKFYAKVFKNKNRHFRLKIYKIFFRNQN